MAAAFSAPLVAGVPSGGTVTGAGATDLLVTSHPANIAFARAGSGWSYAYNGGLSAGVQAWVEAHPLIETRSTTIPLTIAPAGGLMPVANAIFVNTGDSKGFEGMDSIAKAIFDGGYDADPYGNSGNPDNGIPQSGIGGSQSGPVNDPASQGLTLPARMAREKAAIVGYVQQGRTVYSALRMWTNDYITPAKSIENTAIWHNEVVRGGGAKVLVLWGAEPTRLDLQRNADMLERNNLARQYALDNAADVIFIDCYEFLLDQATGLAKAEYYGDPIHKNRVGINALAPLAVPMLDRLCTKKVS